MSHLLTCVVSVCVRACNVVCSRCGLLLCGGLWCTYTTGALNVARAHAPHCDAESDFGLCPSPSLADCSLTSYTQDTYACTVLYVRVYKTYVDTVSIRIYYICSGCMFYTVAFVFLTSIHLCDELLTACVSGAREVSLLHAPM